MTRDENCGDTSRCCSLGVAAVAGADSLSRIAPIKIINPFSAGSPVDFVGRLVANKLEAAWGQPVVVEVRNGAGGTLGANFVAKSPPDGYTLLVTSSSTITSSPVLVKGLPYDPIKDFAPVWAVHSGGLVVVVNPSLPVKTLARVRRNMPASARVNCRLPRRVSAPRSISPASCSWRAPA